MKGFGTDKLVVGSRGRFGFSPVSFAIGIDRSLEHSETAKNVGHKLKSRKFWKVLESLRRYIQNLVNILNFKEYIYIYMCVCV
jgi:hypothetical protein